MWSEKLLRACGLTPSLRSDRGDAGRSVGRSGWGILLIGAAWWLFGHPYWGIWHDARVYTLMAVRWLNPEAFVRDPWFMFGSQDAFTLFSPLYGGSIAWLGVEAAAKAWSFGLGMLFVAASWVFSRAVSRSHHVLLFLALVGAPWVYCVNSYDVIGEMRLSESFVTSRHLAISLSMLGTAAVINGRQFAAAVWFVAGLVIHPLVAIWPLLVAVGVKTGLSAKRLSLLALVGLAVALAASWLGLPGFRHLTGDWAEYVRHTAAIVYPGEGGKHRLGFAALCYVVLGCGYRWGTPSLRRWYLCTLIVAAGAYAVYWFCSAFAPSVIVIQIQAWRANWLALVFAVAAALDLSVRGAKLSAARRLLTISAWAAGLAGGWGAVASLGALAAHPVPFLRLGHRLARRYKVEIFRGLWVILAVVVTFWLALSWEDVQMLVPALPVQYRSGPYAETALLSAIAITGGYGAVPLLAGVWLRTWRCWATLIVGGMALPLAVWTWDQPREPRILESFGIASGHGALFGGLVKPGDTVYWQGRPEYVWYLLGTASYASSTQAIGIVFSERMTMEIARRLERLALADLGADEPVAAGTGRDAVVRHMKSQGLAGFNPANLHGYEVRTLSERGLGFICRDPELDFVVHEQTFPELVRATATQSGKKGPVVWKLYDCGELRQARRARTT